MPEWNPTLNGFLYLTFGISYLCLGLVAALESRRKTELGLGKNLNWLAAYGVTQGIQVLLKLAPLILERSVNGNFSIALQAIMLPLSTLFLLRFGVGLLSDAGPLPQRMTLLPLALIIPMSLLVSYVLVISLSSSTWSIATDVWSRYLFYFPACLLAGIGFLSQREVVKSRGSESSGGDLLLGAAVAFFFNAFIFGLIVPVSPYGFGSWLNYENILAWTKVPIELWRTISAVVVAFFVVRAMGVFEAERSSQLEDLRREMMRRQVAARELAEAWKDKLVLLAKKIAGLEPLADILNTVISSVLDLLDYDLAVIGLWDDQMSKLLLKAWSPPRHLSPSDLNLVSDAYLEAADQGRTLQSESGLFARDHPLHIPGHCSISVPLMFENKCLGFLCASRDRNRGCSPEDRVNLAYLADHAVISLEHASLASQLQSIAVSKERMRIARDMHDGISQLLGFLNLEMQTLEALTRQRNFTGLQDELPQARTRIQEAQNDIRENILSLRTTLADESGLLPSLNEYVDEFSSNTGIKVNFITSLSGSLSLSPLAEVEVVCIIQEALTNIRKHANASWVEVSLSAREGMLNVDIMDDGIGFEMSTKRGHFGLQTMRERADEIAGTISIQSRKNRGTRIALKVPLVTQVESF